MTDWPFDPLTPMKYGAILADPPWAYVMRSEKGHAKSPEAHYDTMSVADLSALPVEQLAGPDCMLFMWSTWPHLNVALKLMADWGFTYITGGSWTKRTNRNWKVCFGTGYVLHSATEPFLVGKLNRPKTVSRTERNVIVADEQIPDSIEAIRREHSRKPDQMREMIERLLPHAYCCELFAREPWFGHEVWGNETTKFAGTSS
ncbi:MT-A70 family protein [Rhodovulum phage RS1]|uniref:DNA methyltransferase n=1 Tax=Rhodobacter phage RC1 TaxID=754055 RepID=UPI0002C1842C|nr:DNA methyltransferase [Rhodobacter phage RC1]YP_007676403.1 DNA methyltransferase [Rhodovulum phage RS1]AGH57989.1 MT-A70 family protein [Rhodovulum phage RS1]AGH58053.1 MT-A70 family protein [Rhodobacter phage RC1]